MIHILENNQQKFNEYAYNEAELVSRLAYFSNRHFQLKMEIDMLNERIKDLVNINATEISKTSVYEENLNKLKAQVNDFESEKNRFKSELKKVQELFDTKVVEMEQMEKDNELMMENLGKTLDKETTTRKDLETQLKATNSKREELLKLKQNLENKLKDCEQTIESKNDALNDASKQIHQLKQEIQNNLTELEKSKNENEKFKSMLSYIKNFNV